VSESEEEGHKSMFRALQYMIKRVERFQHYTTMTCSNHSSTGNYFLKYHLQE